jgi:ABC-type transport system involved in Fe-S cluster assembly fused permease/ATPase subunit
VQAALSRLLTGRTGLVAAHRMASVAGVDRIIVLARGRIVAEGTPAELLRHGKLDGWLDGDLVPDLAPAPGSAEAVR